MIKYIKLVILDSSFFVALGVWSLVKLTGLLHNVIVDEFAFFSFFSTLLVYSFSILFSYGMANSFDILFYNTNLFVQKTVFIISLFVLPIFVFQLKFYVLLLLIPIGIVSFLYPVELIGDDSDKIALREFPYLKIFLIGISWGIVTVILPLLQANIIISYSDVLETFVRAMFVIAITIPFDVRDVYSDSFKMKTLPQKMGVSMSKNLAYVLLFFNFGYYVLLGTQSVESLVLILVTLLVISVLISYSGFGNSKYYYVVLMESSSVLLFLSVWV
jgi:hypothetical protein